ncbi:MAG: hypothetical protein V1875_01715 [Candidatus Altiarchaeota archaeon]
MKPDSVEGADEEAQRKKRFMRRYFPVVLITVIILVAADVFISKGGGQKLFTIFLILLIFLMYCYFEYSRWKRGVGRVSGTLMSLMFFLLSAAVFWRGNDIEIIGLLAFFGLLERYYSYRRKKDKGQTPGQEPEGKQPQSPVGPG